MTRIEFLKSVFHEASGLMDKADITSLKYWNTKPRYHLYLHRSTWLIGEGFTVILSHTMLQWNVMPNSECFCIIIQRPNLVVIQGDECSEVLIKDGMTLYASLRHGAWTKSLDKEALDW